MPSEKKINNLVINEIESFDVYNYMKDNGLLNRSEVYTLYPEAIKNYIESEMVNKADKTYVDEKIVDLVNSAPETLDTLGELATAFEENSDIVEILNQAITEKYSSSNPPPYPVTSVQGKTGAVVLASETWTFTLADGSTITKKVLLG